MAMTQDASYPRHDHHRYARFGTAIITFAAALACLSFSPALGFSGTHWFHANIEHGEIDGYHWAVGAKGAKHEPLSQICAEISMVEPPREGALYVEGRDATDCGSIKSPRESVSVSESFGSGESRVAVSEVIYRPLVSKVTFILSTGERRIYHPRLLQIPNQAARGIPTFRYLVAPFEGETCIRRIATFDGKGSIVSNEARPPCPKGSGNL